MKKAIVFLLLMSVSLFPSPSEKLLDAISVVESHRNDHAVNKKEAAVGRFQIRPAYLKEVNRIQRMKKNTVTYQYHDRIDSVKSREMVKIYLDFWGEQYKKATGKNPTDEVYAKIHNGHAFWKKSSPIYKSNVDRYWNKVKSEMK